jgi:membrane protease YdiL (CAAX protease family)
VSSVREWIRRRQVVAFFAITFVISHLVGISAVFLFSGDHPAARTMQFFIVRLLLFGPALAGLIVAGVSSSTHQQGGNRPRWIAFLTSWILACLVSMLYVWRTTPDFPGLFQTFTISALGALFPAIIISGAFSRLPGLRNYLSTLVRPRGNLIWYLVALFTFPVIHLLGNGITRVLGQDVSRASSGLTPDIIGLALITFVHVLFYTGGINEESGWRGFALPRLQVRFSPLVACLIIWVFHLLWELPFDTVFSDSSWPAISRLVWMPSWSILFVWLYNRTKGSILAPVIFHASMNSMNPVMRILPPTDAGSLVLVAFAAFALVYDRMWRRLPVDSLAVYREERQAA